MIKKKRFGNEKCSFNGTIGNELNFHSSSEIHHKQENVLFKLEELKHGKINL